MMQKILFTNRYTLLDSVVVNLTRDFDVVVLERTSYKYEPLEGVTTKYIEFRTFKLDWLLHRFFKFQISLPLYVIGLRKILVAEQPDIIVVFDFYNFIFWQVLSYIKNRSNIKIILISETKRAPRNIFARLIFKTFLYWLKRNLSKIHCVFVFTDVGIDWFTKNVPGSTPHELFVPIDTSIFQPVASRQWLPDDTLRIIMNARYVPYKRHIDLFEALAQLRAAGRKFILTLIGRDGDRVAIANLVQKYRLDDMVTFLDPLPPQDLPGLYSQYDVLVLPSDGEAIGMVVPEAMACGLPTITSDTVGANQYVVEGVTGIIYKTKDSQALSAALQKCFNASYMQNLSVSGISIINKKYTINHALNIFKTSVPINTNL